MHSEIRTLFLQDVSSICTKKFLTMQDGEIIKDAFRKRLDSGKTYSMEEIEEWLGTGTNPSQDVFERIINIAHYQKAKHEAKNRLKMMPDSCGCGGNC